MSDWVSHGPDVDGFGGGVFFLVVFFLFFKFLFVPGVVAEGSVVDSAWVDDYFLRKGFEGGAAQIG